MADKEEPPREGNNAASEYLKAITGSNVVVKLGSGIEYHGILQAIDGFMNITLQQTQEVYKGKTVADFGDVFLRGSLVNYISSV